MYGLLTLTLILFFLQYPPSQLSLCRLSGCSSLFCGDIVSLVSWLGSIWCRDHLHCTMWVHSALLSFTKLQQISWFHPNALRSILKSINYFSDALLNSVYVWDSLHICAGKWHEVCTYMCVCAQYCSCKVKGFYPIKVWSLRVFFYFFHCITSVSPF